MPDSALPEQDPSGAPDEPANGVAHAAGGVAEAASAEVLVTNEQGLHLRPATEFARVAQASGCSIRVHYDGAEGDGGSVLELAMMAIRSGATLRIEASGAGCEQAVADLVELVRRDFQT